QRLQPGCGRVLQRRSVPRLDHRASRPEPDAALHRRRAGLDRRQPVHLPRHAESACPGLASHLDHPRSGDPHAGISAAGNLGPATAVTPVMTDPLVAVAGLWHLGTVTAACLASRDIVTIGYDPDAETVRKLQAGEPPLFEPGLAELVRAGLDRKTLRFTNSPE